MDKIKVEVDIIRKVIYEFTIDAVLDEYGDVDIEETKVKAAEAYEQALEDGSLTEHYSDEDYDDDCDNSSLKQMCEILEKMGLGIMSDNPNFRAYCKMLERKGLGIVIDF